ncbi:hypothetical protein JCM11491_004689 [Sporobolomyces phaffii]
MAIPSEVPAPLSVTRSYRPYYSPYEIDHLSRLQSTSKSQPDLSEHRLNHFRQLACGYIERVGQRIGFPRRTIATAQSLYHRFHLHFPLRDFAYQDVSLSAILVASKLEDTLKKLRDIQIAGYQVANMMDGGPGQSEGDPSAQEQHRPQLIGIERLILQTICFNFTLHKSLTSSSAPDPLSTLSTPELLTLSSSPTSKDLFSHLLRLSTLLPLPSAKAKSFTYLAFLLATDLFRTLSPLSYPPHTCVAACLRLTAFLYSQPGDADDALDEREVGSEWSQRCESRDEDLDEIAQTLLNLLIALCPPPPPPPLATSSILAATSHVSGGPSPSFSPSQPSPSESVAAIASSSNAPTATASRQTDRDRHLLQTGIPNAFSHEVFTWSHSNPTASEAAGSSSAGGTGKGKGRGGRTVTVDDLREIKIRVREAGQDRRRAQRGGGSTRDVDDADAGSAGSASDERNSKRWKSLLVQRGIEEVQRLKDEADERERYKVEEREEREREKDNGATEEEREREREVRRDRRERGKPGSVRYLF